VRQARLRPVDIQVLHDTEQGRGCIERVAIVLQNKILRLVGLCTSITRINC